MNGGKHKVEFVFHDVVYRVDISCRAAKLNAGRDGKLPLKDLSHLDRLKYRLSAGHGVIIFFVFDTFAVIGHGYGAHAFFNSLFAYERHRMVSVL